MILLAILMAGCSGSNQATESGGRSQSVKYPYLPPVQEVRVEQPNANPAS
jgi:hypothetical protein